MPDIFYLFRKWWKQILAIVFLSLLAVSLLVFLQKQQYVSVATALPENSLNTDKAKIFSENIQELYPSIGTPDELDKILGTAQLDTVYLAVAQKFDLADHYRVKEKGGDALAKAAAVLKKETSVFKSDYGELKVKVWDTDKRMAPQLANAIMSGLDSIHRHIQNETNRLFLEAIKKEQKALQENIDSLRRLRQNLHIIAEDIVQQNTSDKNMSDRLAQYDKLVSQYQVIINSNPSVLAVVEKARISSWPDKPKRLQILIATAFLSLVFSLLVVLILERKKQ